MATLHLMVGLPCSGKTTYALELKKETNGLLLSPDSWQIKLLGNKYGHDDLPTAFYDNFHTNIEGIMWEVAKEVLSFGIDVILDFGFWSLEERDEFRKRAGKLGVKCKIHYMDTPKEELLKRLEIRNKREENDTMIFEPHYLEEWIQLFEAPSKEEINFSI